MIYAEINEENLVVREVVYDPPLLDSEIPTLSNGKKALRPLILLPVDINTETHRDGGWVYQVQNEKVKKVQKKFTLNSDEKKEWKRNRKLECRRNQLPVSEESIEVIARILKGILQRLDMTNNPLDPRTNIDISIQDRNELDKILFICEQNNIRD